MFHNLAYQSLLSCSCDSLDIMVDDYLLAKIKDRFVHAQLVLYGLSMWLVLISLCPCTSCIMDYVLDTQIGICAIYGYILAVLRCLLTYRTVCLSLTYEYHKALI